MQLDSLTLYEDPIKGGNVGVGVVHSGRRLEIGQQCIGGFGYHVRWPESGFAWGREEGLE